MLYASILEFALELNPALLVDRNRPINRPGKPEVRLNSIMANSSEGVFALLKQDDVAKSCGLPYLPTTFSFQISHPGRMKSTPRRPMISS